MVSKDFPSKNPLMGFIKKNSHFGISPQKTAPNLSLKLSWGIPQKPAAKHFSIPFRVKIFDAIFPKVLIQKPWMRRTRRSSSLEVWDGDWNLSNR